MNNFSGRKEMFFFHLHPERQRRPSWSLELYLSDRRYIRSSCLDNLCSGCLADRCTSARLNECMASPRRGESDNSTNCFHGFITLHRLRNKLLQALRGFRVLSCPPEISANLCRIYNMIWASPCGSNRFLQWDDMTNVFRRASLRLATCAE